MSLQAAEGQALKDPNTHYYESLCDRLDLCLVFSEHGGSILSDLLFSHSSSQ